MPNRYPVLKTGRPRDSGSRPHLLICDHILCVLLALRLVLHVDNPANATLKEVSVSLDHGSRLGFPDWVSLIDALAPRSIVCGRGVEDRQEVCGDPSILAALDLILDEGHPRVVSVQQCIVLEGTLDSTSKVSAERELDHIGRQSASRTGL